MAVGDTTEDSIIWVPGEATGKDIYGDVATLPVDITTTSGSDAVAAVAALHTRLVASGILPN